MYFNSEGCFVPSSRVEIERVHSTLSIKKKYRSSLFSRTANHYTHTTKKEEMAQKIDMSKPYDFEGYLTKQSAWLKEWRKRYFVLKENQLHFCKQEGSDPHGTIDLKECLTVKSAEEKTGKRYVGAPCPQLSFALVLRLRFWSFSVLALVGHADFSPFFRSSLLLSSLPPPTHHLKLFSLHQTLL